MGLIFQFLRMPVEKQLLRETVDLSGYPDLVVPCLGMRVNVFQDLAQLRPLRQEHVTCLDCHRQKLPHVPVTDRARLYFG